MKNFLLLLLYLIISVSCSSSRTKRNNIQSVSPKYLTIVDKVVGYSLAYTEDGHTMIYGKDSIDNFIVYYVKFDNNAGKFENSIIKEKIVRVEMDPSLNVVKGFLAITGGTFCDRNEDVGYSVYYFDEQMNGNNVGHIEIPLGLEQLADIEKEDKGKRIIVLLNVAYNIAISIYNSNAKGWCKIVSALEPVQDLITYDIIMNDTIYDPIVNKHIKKIFLSTEGLTNYYNLLREKINYKN